MRIVVDHFHGAADWQWISRDGVCGICQLPFEHPCPECEKPGDDCPPVTGKCRHEMHIHCISKWLGQRPDCPMCRQTWGYSEA